MRFRTGSFPRSHHARPTPRPAHGLRARASRPRRGLRPGPLLLALALAGLALPACQDGGGSGSSGGGVAGATAASSRARFLFDCDLQGLNGVLTLDVEAIQTAGLVFGSGPNPSITGVIGPVGVRYITAGELRSPTALYVFTGDNQFADFTELATSQRFRVEWVPNGANLTVVINPFGPGPTRLDCVQTGSRFL